MAAISIYTLTKITKEFNMKEMTIFMDFPKLIWSKLDYQARKVYSSYLYKESH